MKNREIEVLLVDDNESDVRLTIEALKESKVSNRLHVAEDGEDAMEFLRKTGRHKDAVRPDLILLDINMPRKNGMEVLVDLKNDEDLKTIPVVMLTTSQAEQDVLKSYKLHANCYITKPVDLEQFMTVVQAVDHFWFSVVTLPPK